MTAELPLTRPPSHAALIAALAAADEPISTTTASHWIAEHHALRLDRHSVLHAFEELRRAGIVTSLDDDEQPRRWMLLTPGRRV